MGKLQIELLGASFSAQASEDDAYLAKLLSYYKEITESIKNSSGVKDSLKISILSGIALVDELYRGMQKANWGASPEEKEYWKKQGWLENARPWKN